MAGIDNNTLLYLRGDSFEDLSYNNIDIINNGVNIVDVEDEKFLNFTGGYLKLTLPHTSEDYTIEFDMVFIGDTGYNQFGMTDFNGANSLIDVDGDGDDILRVMGLQTTYVPKKHSNILVHIAGVKKDGIGYVYIDGKLSTQSESPRNLFFNILFGSHPSNYELHKFNANLKNLMISNIARYTEDFTPPTRPYNSITINKTNQTDTNIEFNIEKLGQETINKVEVLVNGTVSETYTDNYDNINYLIDTELCVIGNNDITIRVTFDDTYTEELSLNHKVTVDELPLETPLLDAVERVKLLTKSKQNEKTMLSSILTSKSVEVLEEDKMSDLIGKVDLLGEYDDGKLYLYKDGDECIDLTGGWLKGGYTRGTGTLTKEDDCMELYTNTSANQTVTVLTKNKVNLTGYSKIAYDLTLTASPDAEWSNVGVTDSVSSTSNNPISSTAFEEGKKYINEDITIFCDISNINSNKYVFVCNNTGVNTTATFKIKNIWLEK